MKVIFNGGHNEMCGGWSNNYLVKLEQESTVQEVVQAIHKYQKENNIVGAYGIYINGEIYESSWGENVLKKNYRLIRKCIKEMEKKKSLM